MDPRRQHGNGNGNGQLSPRPSVATITHSEARHIRNELAVPAIAPTAEERIAREDWRVCLNHYDHRQQHPRIPRSPPVGPARGRDDQGAADVGSIMSPRRLHDSILDDDSLSRINLSTASPQTRQRLLNVINRNRDHFRAELDSDRPQQRAGASGAAPAPASVVMGQDGNAGGLAGSGFKSLRDISQRMEELLEAQGTALQQALQHELEIKRLYWLRQYAMRQGDSEAGEERRG